MNRMKTGRYVVHAASLLSLQCIWACSSAAMGDDESYPDNQTPHAVLFEAKWSDTGRFQILNDESGHMGMAVTGSSKDDPRALGKLVGPSFVDTYRSLLPNESVPPLLKALEARRLSVVAPTDESLVVKLDPIDTAFSAEPSNSSHVAICEDYVLMSCSTHRMYCCMYTPHPNPNFAECQFNLVCPSNSDVSFFDNINMNTNSSHALSGVTGSGFVAPANQWGWHQWWTGYPCSRPHIWNAVAGDMGVSTHRRITQPCVQGELSE